MRNSGQREEKTKKKLFRHFESRNKRRVSSADIIKHSLVKQKWSSMKRKSHVLKGARKQQNDLATLVKADRMYISKALRENKPLRTWLDDKANYVHTVVVNRRTYAAKQIQRLTRRWLAVRSAAAAVIQVVARKFLEQLHRKQNIKSMVEEAGTKTYRQVGKEKTKVMRTLTLETTTKTKRTSPGCKTILALRLSKSWRRTWRRQYAKIQNRT